MSNLPGRWIYDPMLRTLRRYSAFAGNRRVLECGTGPGLFLSLLEKWFPRSTFLGSDIEAEVIEKAQRAVKRASCLVTDAQELPFSQASFDALVAFHLIEHLPNPEKFLQEAARVLRPGGLLALATPNPTGLGALVMKDRWSGWAPDHISLRPPEQWRQALQSFSFSILEEGTTGLSGIPPFRKFPLALLNWGPLFLFGFFPWKRGEAYVCLARKENSGS
jgi:ubiquinone/menaquinone biosynthesis C-methylase UbiE